MLSPQRRRTFVPALLAFFLFAGGAAHAQETARLDAPDYSYILKTPEGAAADAPPAPATPAGRDTLSPAPRPAFGRDGGEAGPAPRDGQDQGGAGQTNNLPPPLTAGQKMRRAFRGAFLSPQPYISTAFGATLTQLGEDELPDKDFEDEFGDWASRFARSFATRTTRNIFASGVYPVLFKQDPRYERSRKKGFLRRTGHAVSRVFVTRDDDSNLEPNYSRFAGVMTASAMANIWERSTPGHDRIGTDATLKRFGRSFINDSLSNIVFKEFWPDIMKIFGR